MVKPLVPLLVVRDGGPWKVDAAFSGTPEYGHHLASLERITSYDEMLEHLEHLVVRLRRAATIDRKAAKTQEEWLSRSAEKTQAFFEHVCVAHDIRRNVGYAARFLNTTAVYANGTLKQRQFAHRGGRVIATLLFPPDWRPRGPQRLQPVDPVVGAMRATLLVEVRNIWRLFDVSDRRAELLKHISALGWLISLPHTIGRQPPARATDLVIGRHTGIGQKRLRRVVKAAGAELIYQ